MQENSKEKRAHPRFSISQMIEIHAGREGFIHTTGKNISLGGLFCESDESVDPYSRVFLMINLPQKDGSTYVLKSEGIVMRCEPIPEGGYGLGIHFTELSSLDSKKIEEHIAYTKESSA